MFCVMFDVEDDDEVLHLDKVVIKIIIFVSVNI